MYTLRGDLSTATWRKSSYSNGGANNCVEMAEGLWRKSSYSNGGENNCLEVADGLWRKSTYSNGGQNSCVEVADGFDRVVPVRDSKNPGGAILAVPADAWQGFVDHVKD